MERQKDEKVHVDEIGKAALGGRVGGAKSKSKLEGSGKDTEGGPAASAMNVSTAWTTANATTAKSNATNATGGTASGGGGGSVGGGSGGGSVGGSGGCNETGEGVRRGFADFTGPAPAAGEGLMSTYNAGGPGAARGFPTALSFDRRKREIRDADESVKYRVDESPTATPYESIAPTMLTLLNRSWCLWYTNGTAKTAQTFENFLIPVGTFSTVEAFWALYSYCVRPSALMKGTEYLLFREGVRPMWEDPANQNGGTLLVRLRKSTLNYFWESLVLALIGEQLDEDVVGAVASKRYSDDHLSIWNSDYDDKAHKRLSTKLLAVLNLPANSPTDYKSHSGSLSQQTQQPGKPETKFGSVPVI